VCPMTVTRPGKARLDLWRAPGCACRGSVPRIVRHRPSFGEVDTHPARAWSVATTGKRAPSSVRRTGQRRSRTRLYMAYPEGTTGSQPEEGGASCTRGLLVFSCLRREGEYAPSPGIGRANKLQVTRIRGADARYEGHAHQPAERSPSAPQRTPESCAIPPDARRTQCEYAFRLVVGRGARRTRSGTTHRKNSGSSYRRLGYGRLRTRARSSATRRPSVDRRRRACPDYACYQTKTDRVRFDFVLTPVH